MAHARFVMMNKKHLNYKGNPELTGSDLAQAVTAASSAAFRPGLDGMFLAAETPAGTPDASTGP
jgi:hypothetical protein